VTNHNGDEGFAVNGCICVGAAAHPSDENAVENIHMSEPSLHVAHKSIGEAEKPCRNAPSSHGRTGEDKERDCQGGEGIHPGDHSLDEDLSWNLRREDEIDKGRHHDRKRDGHPRDHAAKEKGKDGNGIHRFPIF